MGRSALASGRRMLKMPVVYKLDYKMPVMHKLDYRISDPSSHRGELGPREYVRRYE